MNKKWGPGMFVVVALLGLIGVLGYEGGEYSGGCYSTQPDNPTQLVFDLPLYIHWGWGTYQNPMTDADYDHLAQHDVVHLPSEALVNPRFIGVVDAIRERNPRAAVLVYQHIYGANKLWADSAPGTYWSDMFQLGAANDSLFFTKDVDGNVMSGAYNAYYFNPSAAGLADSLAIIFKKHMTLQGNMRHHVGVFCDFFAYPYVGWIFGDYSFDWDQNGTPYEDQPLEELYNYVFVTHFASKYRSHFDDRTFLIVPNLAGDRHNVIASNGSQWDGVMYEYYQTYYPTSTEYNLQEAMLGDYELLSHDRINPPIIMLQRGEYDGGETGELLGAMFRSGGTWHRSEVQGQHGQDEPFYDLPDDLELGWLVEPPEWSATGDTITARFTSGTTVRVIQQIGNSNPAAPHWPGIAISAKGDTLRRIGSWPRQEE